MENNTLQIVDIIGAHIKQIFGLLHGAYTTDNGQNGIRNKNLGKNIMFLDVHSN